MTESAIKINSPECVESWFLKNGVDAPLSVCIGPLPSTGAYVAQWTSLEFDERPRDIVPHPDFLRLSVMLDPLESEVWRNGQQIWGGVIGAQHFRVCGPDERGRWTQLSPCNIANVFVPLGTVRRYVRLAGHGDDRWPQVSCFTQDRRVTELARQMLDASTVQGGLGLHYCDGLMTALMAYLLEHYAEPEGVQQVSALRGAPLRRVLAHMDALAGRHVYVAELAALCGMSESHFAREFKRALGMPPHQYMLRSRLEEARHALSDTEERIGDIAINLGFSDASHFSRLFSNRFGITPTSFRRRQRQAGGYD